MVIVKLMGGLGNQMFQYAAGKALSLRLHTPLLLDTTFLEADPKGAYTKRHFELDAFQIQAKTATPADLSPFMRRPRNRYTIGLQRRFPGLFGNVYYAEKGLEFQAGFHQLKGNVYLEGYWQSEQYFREYAEAIRKDFSRSGPVPDATGEWEQRIRAVNAVSMHIRRGDYISNRSDNEFHGTCTMAYYEAAVSRLKQEIPAFEIFLFSDDPDWCREYVKLDVPIHIVTQPGLANHWDLYLMSLCRHHIIANSSFSWWGAWLNPDPSKCVIAPQQWFAGSAKSTTDLIPSAWIRL